MTTGSLRVRGLSTVARRIKRDQVVWVAPIAIALATRKFADNRIQLALAAFLAAALLYWASKRPMLAFGIGLAFVTTQQVFIPLLWHYGLPSAVARQLGGIKDILLLGVLWNAIRQLRADKQARRFDLVDKLVLGYVALAVVYLVAPWLFYPALATSFSTRLLAFRFDAGYVLVFFALRHADLGENAKRKFTAWLLGIGAFVGVGAAIQRFAPGSWRHFIFNTAKAQDFKVQVLHIAPFQASQAFAWIRDTGRVGSFMIAPHDMSHFMIVAFAFCVERLVRSRDRTTIIAATLIGSAIAFSQTRAHAIAMLLVIGLALLPKRGRTPQARIAVVGILFVVAIGVIPAIGGTRFTGAQGGSASSQGHVNEIRKGFQIMGRYPLGTGLGNGPSTADRFQLDPTKPGAFTTSDFLTQVGDEFGIPALILYVVMLGAVAAGLIVASRDDPFASAAVLALAAVCVVGFYHHVFVTLPPAWAFWGAAGVALRQRPATRPQPAFARATLVAR